MLGILIVAGLLQSVSGSPQSALEVRVDQILSKMSLADKISILGGDRGFYVKPFPQYGLRELKMSDGPMGIRNYGPAPAYPGGTCAAATFDPNLARALGVAIGEDARARAVDIWLGPGVNLARVPQCGRTWEYFSEDPFLVSQLAVQEITGAQSQGIAPTIKHFAANEHEWDRNNDNSVVDEQVLRELYLRPFEAAAKAGVFCLMTSYNLVNGTHASENEYLIRKTLKGEWGFKGVVMSDWVSVYSSAGPANAGLDLEMPNAAYMNLAKLEPLINSGVVPMANIDDKVRRLIRLNLTLTEIQSRVGAKTIAQANEDHRQLIRDISASGTVLLKNDNSTLPLDRKKVQKIVVLGPTPNVLNHQGGGSGYTTPANPMTLVEALKKVAGTGVEVEFLGSGEFNAPDFGPKTWDLSLYKGIRGERELVGTRKVSTIGGDWTKKAPEGLNQTQNYSLEYRGKVSVPAPMTLVVQAGSDDGVRVKIDGKIVIDEYHDRAFDSSDKTVELSAGEHSVDVDYYQGGGDAVLQFRMVKQSDLEKIDVPVEKVKSADAVIIGVGWNAAKESEGSDRKFELSNVQNALVATCAKLNPRTIVTLTAGGAADVSGWVSSVGALVHNWYPGQEGTESVARILFGDINPSGKLPLTMPKTLVGTYYADAYPSKNREMVYREGLEMGYRWFDAHKVAPLFEFGFGLSYTSFTIEPQMPTPNSNSIWIPVKVTNTGKVTGDEVVQVYTELKNPDAKQPFQRLVAFQRVHLEAGESKTVQLSVDRNSLSWWNKNSGKWQFDPGTYRFKVGSSSRKIAGAVDLVVQS